MANIIGNLSKCRIYISDKLLVGKLHFLYHCTNSNNNNSSDLMAISVLALLPQYLSPQCNGGIDVCHP